MSIKDLSEKIKSVREVCRDKLGGQETFSKYYTAIIVILVGLSSFGLGRLSAIDESRQPIIIENMSEIAPPTATVGGEKTQTASVASSVSGQTSNVKNSSPATGGKLVASKNGTKYYFPWCGSASNIAEKNKIWFSSEEEARAKGYTPAANCKGLK